MAFTIVQGPNHKVNTPNNSLIMGRDCGPASKHCIRECYPLKAWKAYPSVQVSWKGNSNLLRTDPNAYFGAITRYLNRVHPPLYRIHVSGDFITQDHFDRWVGVAAEYQETGFLAFTKSFPFLPVDSDTLPSNFSVVLSLFPSMVGSPEDIPVELWDSYPMAYAGDRWDYFGTPYWTRVRDANHCPGKCGSLEGECDTCWVGEDVHFPIH
jgi:hypothetical protein